MTQKSMFIDLSNNNSLLANLLTDNELVIIVRRCLLITDKDPMPRIINSQLQEAMSEAFGFMSDYFRLIINVEFHVSA